MPISLQWLAGGVQSNNMGWQTMHNQVRQWSTRAWGGGQRTHLVKIVRCRFALRRFASFITARSISTSLRLAFCHTAIDLSATMWAPCSLQVGLCTDCTPPWSSQKAQEIAR